MKARIGDRLIIHGTHLDEAVRGGEVLEVHGPEGSGPFLVRWDDNGHESLFFPGAGAHVVSSAHEGAAPAEA